MHREVFIVEQVMDEATCRLVRAAMDDGAAEPTEILDDEIAVVEEVRLAWNIEVEPAVLDLVESCLDAQLEKVSAFFGLPRLSREGVSLLRYRAGGFYKRHVDRAELPSWPAAADREITVVLFLNDSRAADPESGFSGGVLLLHVDEEWAPVEIVPRRGRLVAFPADTPHEVTPVVDGSRDTMVDWLSVAR